ncbi:MAG: glycoside hydrolase family 15 protein [Acidobacteriota bacterium]
MSRLIEDYGMIGDCLSAALVSKAGSIDWLCFPRFDSPAFFAALLGNEDHGFWRLSPQGEVREVRRRYRDGTLILETSLVTDEGEVTLIDFMPPRSEEPDVVRIVEGKRGQVRICMELVIRMDYGSIIPWVRKLDGGIHAIAGPDVVRLDTPVETHGEDFKTVAEFTVSEGERVPFVLMWYPSHLSPPAVIDSEEVLESTEKWWLDWSSRLQYDGPWKESVIRSLITLKALIYAPTGAITAAPTTSLPEKLGGVRNWDYRYCWLRDATFTLYSLMNAGCTAEAEAWRDWLLRAVAGDPSQLHIMYGLSGERRLMEWEIDWLPGYEDSAPVRIGNAASSQHQLDVYGEVMDALHVARKFGIDPEPQSWRVQRAIVGFLEENWKEPDHGIWEVRGPMRHFTHSKVMAWVAMDRAIKAVENFGLEGPADRWRRIRDEIHEEVCEKGFNPEANSFVQYYGSELPDAALLMIPLVGFLPADDPRVAGTVEAVERHLMRDDFVDRYVTIPDLDGLPPGEGSFLACTLWLADNYLLLGRYEHARRIFERVLSLQNDVGLLAEQYDPRGKRFLGNFPQAFSHVGLVNTALNLSRAEGPAEQRAENGE